MVTTHATAAEVKAFKPRTAAQEVRLALRAAKVMRRHIGYARNLGAMSEARRQLLQHRLGALAELERELCADVVALNETKHPRG